MMNDIFYASNICASSQKGYHLNRLSLTLYKGEIVGLLGNRYAGKSALFQAMMGQIPLISGTIMWNGSVNNPRPVIARVGRHSAMIDELLVWENAAILWQQPSAAKGLNSKKMRNMIRLYFEDYQVHIDLNVKTSSLSQMDKLLVEILMAVRNRAKILLIDLAGIACTTLEYQKLRDLLLRITSEGISAIVSSHQAAVVTFLADRIAVLHNGRILKVIDNGVNAETLLNRMTGMLFKEETLESPKTLLPAERVLQIQNLEAGLRCPISFDLKRGELLTVVSPQPELFQTLSRRILGGVQEKTCTVLFQGKPIRQVANGEGIFFLDTSNLDKLIDGMTPLENLCLGISDRAGILGMEKTNIVRCIERDFYDWYGHEGLLRQKDCRTLYKKHRIAINLFRLRYLKTSVIICNDLNVHNDLVTYRMVKEALISMNREGTAVCLLTSGFAYQDELMQRYIVLDGNEERGMANE